MFKSLFITGTDTGVGKTIVTGLLGRLFAEKGIRTVTQKWIQTGCDGAPEDIALHVRLMKKGNISGHLEHRAPYTLKFPSAPHLAARMEGKVIRVDKIEKSLRYLEKTFDFVIVEGTGGIMVPIDDKQFIMDIVKKLELPVLIVAENRLGAINQVLLTVDALKKRNFRLIGIIFNRLSETDDELILKDNMEIVEKLSGIKVLGELHYNSDSEVLYEMFKPTGNEVYRLVSC